MQEIWDITRVQLNWIHEHLNDAKGLDNKKLQCIRGFWYIWHECMRSMKPYLKGLHATIDSWQPGRNKDGWKIKVDPELQWELNDLGGNEGDPFC
jgi:hypothetical protein